MKHYTRVLARVDLDAVEYNIEMMKKNIQKYLTGMMLLERYQWESVEKELSRKLDTTW